ncbi:MAG: hypothetical protein K5985_01470 [Lachnospiraceae bacterium]|nr:hypothetical protein [Lachnospiraceae bacterium]
MKYEENSNDNVSGTNNVDEKEIILNKTEEELAPGMMKRVAGGAGSGNDQRPLERCGACGALGPAGDFCKCGHWFGE